MPEVIATDSSAHLRAATSTDVPTLIDLYGDLHDGETPDVDLFAVELQTIQKQESRRIYVYEVDGEIVGTVDFFLMRNLTRGLQHWAGVENFVVDASHRRQGHGRIILEAVIATARNLGAYKVQLISSDRRVDAHNLYTTVGFNAPVSGFRIYLTDVNH